jgi:uncharacterized protein
MIEPFQIPSIYNDISGLMVLPPGTGRHPCVVLSHGLVSSKDSSKYAVLSDLFAAADIASCRFDYHGCGDSGGNIEETTLTIRLENLDRVVEHVLGHHRVDPGRLGLLGSSFGGVTTVVKAARDSRVKCISFWATPFRLEKEGDGKISDIEFKDTIYDDFSRYNILDEAGRVSYALGIHGEMDEVVPCDEGKAIYRQMKRPKKFELIRNGDHVFSNPLHRDKALNLALNWFRRFFPGL